MDFECTEYIVRYCRILGISLLLVPVNLPQSEIVSLIIRAAS